MSATIKLMRRYPCTVVPINIRARNSLLYYLLEAVNPELRDLLRFREVIGKMRQRFDLTIGHPITPEAITGSPSDAIFCLQSYVEIAFEQGHRLGHLQNPKRCMNEVPVCQNPAVE